MVGPVQSNVGIICTWLPVVNFLAVLYPGYSTPDLVLVVPAKYAGQSTIGHVANWSDIWSLVSW